MRLRGHTLSKFYISRSALEAYGSPLANSASTCQRAFTVGQEHNALDTAASGPEFKSLMQSLQKQAKIPAAPMAKALLKMDPACYLPTSYRRDSVAKPATQYT